MSTDKVRTISSLFMMIAWGEGPAIVNGRARGTARGRTGTPENLASHVVKRKRKPLELRDEAMPDNASRPDSVAEQHYRKKRA